MSELRLKELYAKNGLLANDVAKKMDMCITSLSKYNAGILFPKNKVLSQLKELLGVEYVEMFVLEGYEHIYDERGWVGFWKKGVEMYGEGIYACYDEVVEASKFRIRTLYKKKGLNGRQFSKQLGVLPEIVAGYNTGVKTPTYNGLKKICSVLGCCLPELYVVSKEYEHCYTAEGYYMGVRRRFYVPDWENENSKWSK